ncbi:MAG: lipopolysaccharide biosynthesis protein [Muribaculaceae bacterium]|nr:lipopolysaccharide biosynthesis protein [Muribaculaceae bacterium]
MDHTFVKKGISGAVWASLDRFGFMVIQFTMNLILARLLTPEDFGIIGMLTIFIAISQTLIDGGFNAALIQKKEATQTDYSTILYWNIGFSFVLYLILFVCATQIGKFFKMEILCGVLRVIAVTIVLNAIISVQRARLQKKLAFKTLAVVNLSSYIIGVVSAIVLAKCGYGVWSLVSLQLIYGTCCILLLLIITKWIPSLTFSYSAVKGLFGFGGYLLAANILQTICINIQGIIIGKRFSATQMGYYSQAYRLDQVISASIPQVIVQVMYPIYSSLQDDLVQLNKICLQNMRVLAFIMFPILSTLIIIAEPLIRFLYGDKWMPSVPYFRVLLVGGFFVCLQNLNYYAVASVGKSKALFYWSFYKWGFLLCALLIGMNFGMYGILWGMVLSSINIYITNAFLAQKHTKLKIYDQLNTIIPIFFTMVISVGFGLIGEYLFGNIILTSLISICSYLILSKLFRLKAFQETIRTVLYLIKK